MLEDSDEVPSQSTDSTKDLYFHPDDESDINSLATSQDSTRQEINKHPQHKHNRLFLPSE